MISLDNALWLVGIAAEATVVGLLAYRRAWRLLPVFLVLCIWDLFCDAGNYILLHHSSANVYLTAYLIETAVGSVLELCVLVELTWSVLRPIRGSLPQKTLLVIGCAIIAISAAIWPTSGVHWQAQMSLEANLLAQLQQTVSIVRVLFFIALAGCSQLLSIGWRDRELQVATGLGFYSLVSLGAAMLRTHQTSLAQYSHLNQIVVASYIISLLYWVFAFAQKEAARREFTPKMEQFLLGLAGNARAARLAMASSSGDDQQSGRNS